jgi:hypothetical protein
MKILWIPHAAWRISQRAHPFCRALSERHEVHVTDWAADFYSWRDYLSIRYPRSFFYRRFREGQITIHGVPHISPALFFPLIRRWNLRVFSFVVDRIIRKYRIDVVVGTFVVNPPKAPRLIFDLYDDNVAYWREYGPVKEYVGEIESVERAYLLKADAVVSASSVMAEKAKAISSRPIHLIPNAVDLKLFQETDNSAQRAQWGAPGFLVGVLGNFDKPDELQLVLDTADILRGEDFSFIIAGRGSTIPKAKFQAAKRGLSRIHFVGEIPLQNAAGVVSAFDAGLCPYRKNAFSDACSPMRLLLYTAAGLPTVCTDLTEVRRMNFPNVMSAEDHPESLAECIRRIRNMPRSRPSIIADYDLPRLAEAYERVLRG